MKKVVSQFLHWLAKAWYSFRDTKPFINDIENQNPRFRFTYAEDLPNHFSENIIFIIQDGVSPELLVFKCPCGCDEKILLNLLEDARPLWRFELNGGLIDISPSIWRSKGCRSHFFVKKSNVNWV